jgi:hypothetical protein
MLDDRSSLQFAIENRPVRVDALSLFLSLSLSLSLSSGSKVIKIATVDSTQQARTPVHVTSQVAANCNRQSMTVAPHPAVQLSHLSAAIKRARGESV